MAPSWIEALVVLTHMTHIHVKLGRGILLVINNLQTSTSNVMSNNTKLKIHGFAPNTTTKACMMESQIITLYYRSRTIVKSLGNINLHTFSLSFFHA